MKYRTATLSLSIFILTACGTQVDTPAPVKKEAPKTVKKATLPPPPKSTHKPKEVQDTNYDASYMYPEDSKKKQANSQTNATTSAQMSKEECIAMVTQEKFDKYTAMFGSEEASIKRCQMIKAMSS